MSYSKSMDAFGITPEQAQHNLDAQAEMDRLLQVARYEEDVKHGVYNVKAPPKKGAAHDVAPPPVASSSTWLWVAAAAALVVVGGAAYLLSRKSYTANKAAKRRRSTGMPRWIKGYPSGSFSTAGVSTCRAKPPKGYPRARAKYALPECFMYPLDTRKRVRTAASRFGKHKRRYAPAVRAKIARRLDAAKRRFGIGEYR